MAAMGPQNGLRNPVFGRSHQRLLNMFFDTSTPSARKADEGEKNILFRGGNMLLRRVICCSGGLYSVQEGYMDAREGCVLFRGVVCCSGGLYAVQEGYMDVQEGCILFRRVICCLGGLYAVQDGYMDVQVGGLYVEENNVVFNGH